MQSNAAVALPSAIDEELNTNIEEAQNNDETEEMIKLVPDVMKVLTKNGLQSDMLTFFRQVKEEKFP